MKQKYIFALSALALFGLVFAGILMRSEKKEEKPEPTPLKISAPADQTSTGKSESLSKSEIMYTPGGEVPGEFAAFLAQASLEEIKEQLAVLEQDFPATNEENAALYAILFKYWGALAPEEAIEYTFKKFPENKVRLEAGGAALKSWIVKDALDAGNYLYRAPETFGHGHLLEIFPQELTKKDPQHAMRWSTLLSNQYRDKAMRLTAQTWLAENPQATVDYTQSYAQERAKKLAQDPEEFDGPEYDELFIATSRYLVSTDTSALVSWVENIPKGRQRQMAMLAATDWWIDKSPHEATKWLSEIDRGHHVDAIFVRVARSVGTIGPEIASAWAEAITDPDARADAVNFIQSYQAAQKK
jgi:hypothetical protein